MACRLIAISVAPLYLFDMLQRTLPAGFIAPCLPTKTDKLPSGSQWLHEIKHDGFRIIARKNGAQVRLDSRPGNDLTHRFPLIVDALSRLRSRSCIIDGEAVACDDNGVAGQDQGSFFRCQTAPWKYSYMLGGVVSLCSLAMCLRTISEYRKRSPQMRQCHWSRAKMYGRHSELFGSSLGSGILINPVSDAAAPVASAAMCRKNLAGGTGAARALTIKN